MSTRGREWRDPEMAFAVVITHTHSGTILLNPFASLLPFLPPLGLHTPERPRTHYIAEDGLELVFFLSPSPKG